MKRLIFIVLITFCSTSFSVELICSGIAKRQILNIRGDFKGKTSLEKEVKAEISLDTSNSVPVVKNIFSADYDVSWCFIDAFKNAHGKCGCKTNDTEIVCSWNYEKQFSEITVNRKTAIAKIIQSRDWGSKDADSSYTVIQNAELQCQVFEKNKF